MQAEKIMTSDDYYIPDYLQFDNVVYKKNIKTVLLFPETAELSFLWYAQAKIELGVWYEKLSFNFLKNVSILA